MLTLCRLLTQNTNLTTLDQAKATLGDISATDWDTLVRQARKSLLLAQLADTVLSASEDPLSPYANNKLTPGLPNSVVRHLKSAQVLAAAHHKAVSWELNRIESALSAANTKVVLLKGAAYLAQQVPHARHRLYGDIDILVPHEKLSEVEERLKWAGWAATQHSAYDEQYYRQWMHEIPPLQHAKRGTSLDVHHRILPPTARITVAGEPLLENAVRSEHFPFFYTLNPVDQWVHSSAHLFSEGEADHGLRDLFDLFCLAQHFLASNAEYLHQVVSRSNQLGASRLTFYALKYLRHFFWPELSTDYLAACNNKPDALLLLLMDTIFSRTLRPQHLSSQLSGNQVAAKLLYFRGHYLKMPWHLLIPHLLKKSVNQDKSASVG